MQDVTIPTDTEIEEINPLHPKRVDMTFDDLVKHVETRRDSKTLVSSFVIQLQPFEPNAMYNYYWDILTKKGEVTIINVNKSVEITQDGELVPDWRERLMKFWFSTMNGLEQLKKIYLMAKVNYETDVHISFEEALPRMCRYFDGCGDQLRLKNNFGLATGMISEYVFFNRNNHKEYQAKRTPDGTKQSILNLLNSRLECFQLQSSLTEKMILSEIREEYHPLVTKNEIETALRELKNEGKVVKLNEKFDYWEAVGDE